MPQDLDLNALARFAAVVEHGGFSSAARALGQPRQSIHRSVAALEAEAGVRLLERTTRSVRLTAAGRRLHEHASSILRAAREARTSLVEARATPRGRLRLTAPAPVRGGVPGAGAARVPGPLAGRPGRR